MVSEATIQAEQQRLYESASLRDDLNDEEAGMLLTWGEAQVARLAVAVSADDFEKQCRFLRQLIKSINRFVGQREFNQREGQLEYLNKVEKWLEKVESFDTIPAESILDKLPPKSHMMTDLKTVLAIISPAASQDTDKAQEATEAHTSTEKTDTLSYSTTDEIIMAGTAETQKAPSPAAPPEAEASRPETNVLSSLYNLFMKEDNHDEEE